VEEAAARVRDGDIVVAGGCLFSRTPMALVREILRQRRRDLTLVRNLMCTEGELMMVAGAVRRVVTAWMSIGLPWGVSKIMREFVEGGAVAFEEWSHLALGLRLRAAAMGIPFLPTLTMLGSDLAAVQNLRTVEDPYTGERLAAVPALYPDVAILHVHRADRFGNAQIDGYPHMDADMARAAATVLVTAEEIVPEDEIRAHPDRTVIPGFLVDAVARQPFGAFPHECYGLYEADFDHFQEYTDAIAAHGAQAVRDYLEQYVFGPATFGDYLDRFGGERLARQQRRARELTSAWASAPDAAPGEWIWSRPHRGGDESDPAGRTADPARPGGAPDGGRSGPDAPAGAGGARGA
jgi:glutaconate CoA-transferase subunit A